MSLAHDHDAIFAAARPAAGPARARRDGAAAGRSLLEQSLVGPETTLHAVIERFTTGQVQIALVVDGRRRLLGVVTDGDIRRAILRGIGTDAPARRVMNASPRTLRLGEALDAPVAYMRRERIRHLPVVDFAGRAIDLLTIDALLAGAPTRPNHVVIMAGGKGMRLRPLTENTPKPMLEVGGKPILETIVRRCAEAGFADVHISVNHCAEVIKRHFGDGAALGVRIRYIEEDRPLGTAGPLGLVAAGLDRAALVMNGDVLSKVDPGRMLDFHDAHGSAATMGVREYEFQVPYGVVDLDGHRIRGMREKPVERHFINAGLYVIEPAVSSLIARGEPCDMPDLFERARGAGLLTAAYPIREYWVDIGRLDDYRRANDEFAAIF